MPMNTKLPTTAVIVLKVVITIAEQLLQQKQNFTKK